MIDTTRAAHSVQPWCCKFMSVGAFATHFALATRHRKPDRTISSNLVLMSRRLIAKIARLKKKLRNVSAMKFTKYREYYRRLSSRRICRARERIASSTERIVSAVAGPDLVPSATRNARASSAGSVT